MKAWEICKKENVGFAFTDGNSLYFVDYTETGGIDIYELSTKRYITDSYYLSSIMEKDFNKVKEINKL